MRDDPCTPYRRLPDGGWEFDTSLLFLIGIRTIVMGGIAAQHVQPCPRNPFIERNWKSRRAPLAGKAAFGLARPTDGPVAQLVRAHP